MSRHVCEDREQFGSRGAGNCVNKSGSIRCEVPDVQIGRIMGAIIFPDSYMDRLLAKIQLADEVKRVNKERQKVERKLKKLGQVYLDNDLMEYEEFQRQIRQLDEFWPLLWFLESMRCKRQGSCSSICPGCGRKQSHQRGDVS